MKKVILGLIIISTFVLAGVKTVGISPQVLQSSYKIIDIRTKSEWMETGIVKGSIPIMFFDARGNYDAQKFIDMLSGYVKKNEEFALICRTGRRSTVVSNFLGDMGYNVVNLQGGIKSLLQQGYKLAPYQ
ncbi:rhodanese-like domain-containing protein [Sulfurospirillum arcachonense]|uniref:rhodanese-like domain-containing protein n=1 Tax=Sulfurospirillum arcachonense TaxID=57666 RepID=UPI00046B0971|nr:rhodanese-like domain-containing protein [Sulfurospirillum arcachonense]